MRSIILLTLLIVSGYLLSGADKPIPAQKKPATPSQGYRIVKNLSKGVQTQLKVLVKPSMSLAQIRIIAERIVAKYDKRKYLIVQIYNDKRVILNPLKYAKIEQDHYLMSIERTPLTGNKTNYVWKTERPVFKAKPKQVKQKQTIVKPK